MIRDFRCKIVGHSLDTRKVWKKRITPKSLKLLERETRFELATLTLATWCVTRERIHFRHFLCSSNNYTIKSNKKIHKNWTQIESQNLRSFLEIFELYMETCWPPPTKCDSRPPSDSSLGSVGHKHLGVKEWLSRTSIYFYLNSAYQN